MRSTIRVLLIEDDKDWIQIISEELNCYQDIKIIGIAHCSEEALKAINKKDVDVVLMDIFLQDNCDGIELTAQLLEMKKEIKIIMLTSSDEDTIIFHAYTAGAIDYVVKSESHEIIDAIRAAYENRSPIRPTIAHKIRKEFCKLRKKEQMTCSLTKTEISILKLIDQGYTQKEIANHLVISIQTVKNHVSRILKKLSAKNSKHAVCKAREMGFL
ncbi:transcriptional regulator [Anoxybacillus gonensis]|uniref:Response regulator transcription factor n=1 Tax=Anoxybacillus gonensis TaxID=198467 RepID=A0AAW7TJ18_9BACL|nr:response regulator transcription factor [Anoxybacillus gonensis]THD17734.1 DNA-binding response regulator [Anoxybacillus ayderensis]AKS39540.1 transcriptional regulator [Anoxybacillus gonensis]KGP59654.1 transcriptional regulator [Anoxybacillus gonensis]MCX8046786.1 response regulator transcription factor [Anoxybacillus gonensis]MDO0878385.1 response regulator transcription factor [Anoxybacillus gonensis]